MKTSVFAKYAWFTLIYNIVVIIWGVFLRASKSGDGCGKFWLTCNGELIPTSPQFKTIIEFTHRLMSGLDFFVVLILFIWAFIVFAKNDQVRRFALLAFFFIIAEALIGMGLVLTGNTADSVTLARPFWAIAHLITTFFLLASLALTAWLSAGKRRINYGKRNPAFALMLIGLVGLLLIGTSGSLAALSGTLFPAESLREGLIQDFSSASHILLRIRISHPIFSVCVGLYLIFYGIHLKSIKPGDRNLNRLSNGLIGLVILQMIFGGITFLMLAPIIMQMAHLSLAVAVWITFILTSASALSNETAKETVGQASA